MSTYRYQKLSYTIPEPLCCFAGVYLPQFSSVYIQGGYGDTENKNIYCMNMETQDWRFKLSNSESLVGHSAVEVEGRMFIFGGWNEKEYTNQMILYDPLDDSLRKSLVPAGQSEWEYPAGRRDHSLTQANNNIYLLGGWDSWKWSNAPSSFVQLWKLSSDWKWELCEVFGENPSTRRGHSTIYFEDLDELVVFGGIYGLSSLLGDLFVLNLKDMLWNKVTVDNEPSKRAWHCAANVQKFMYVFGGLVEIKKCANDLWRFNLEEKLWQEIKVEDSPSPRCGALMLKIEGFLMILGGKNQNDEVSNEGYILDIDEHYQKFRENVLQFGVITSGSDNNIKPPPLPKELTLSRRYARKTAFNPSTFT